MAGSDRSDNDDLSVGAKSSSSSSDLADMKKAVSNRHLTTQWRGTKGPRELQPHDIWTEEEEKNFSAELTGD